MIVVGLDIASKTGWARWSDGEWTTGVVDCSPRSKDEPDGMRFTRLADALPEILAGADAVILERPFSRGNRTKEVLSGLIGVALVAVERTAGPPDYAFVHPSAVKTAATGKGRASKEEVVAGIRERTGLSGLSDDEADAVGVVLHGLEHFGLGATPWQ